MIQTMHRTPSNSGCSWDSSSSIAVISARISVLLELHMTIVLIFLMRFQNIDFPHAPVDRPSATGRTISRFHSRCQKYILLSDHKYRPFCRISRFSSCNEALFSTLEYIQTRRCNLTALIWKPSECWPAVWWSDCWAKSDAKEKRMEKGKEAQSRRQKWVFYRLRRYRFPNSLRSPLHKT